MKIVNKEAYLCLTYNHQRKCHVVRFIASFEGAVNEWTGYTRISPLWGVAGYASAKPTNNSLAGRSSLLFLGPVHPSAPFKSIRSLRDKEKVNLWIGMGSYNFVICSRSNEYTNEIIDWAKANSIPFECWDISDGVILEYMHTDHAHGAEPWRASVMRLASERPSPVISPLIQEYCALTATTLSRARITDSQLFEQVSLFSERIISIIRKQLAIDSASPDAISTLTNVNAALSRFSSQAFSGLSPITGTECHFWIHSLLGIGVANLAFSRFVNFIHQKIGQEKIDLKLKALADRTDAIPSIEKMTKDVNFICTDHLSNIVLPDEFEERPLVPLITYFSGRDGYRSHVQVLSAPLTAVWESISYRSSLLTTTHEIGHIFVQAVLAKISPNDIGDYTFDHARTLVRPQYTSNNWLDAIRQLFLESILAMEAAEFARNPKYDELTVGAITQLMVRWRRDVEEIMVHVFDFIYFYGQDAQTYVRGIWHSWSAIPNISTRIPDYVKRTLCAILSVYLKDPEEATAQTDSGTPLDQLDLARDLMVSILKEVITSDPSNPFVRDAVTYLERNWETTKKAMKGRAYLVKLVVCFLHSQQFAKRLLQDAHRRSGAGGHQGYPHRVLELDEKRVGNPLRFIQAYSRAQTNSAESLWALTTLAFNLEGSEQ